MNKTKAKAKIREWVPTPALIIYALSVLCAASHIIGIMSPSYADFFNFRISPIFRGVLGYLTCWFPFSFAETFLLFMPVALVAVIAFVVPRASVSKRASVRYIISLFSIIALLYSVFVLTFAYGYRGTSLADKLGIEERSITVDELYEAAEILTEKVNGITEQITFKSNSSSIMPYSYREMSKKLTDAYNSLADKYDFIPKFHVGVKQIMLSEPMTYTHVSGVYTFFTSEANINTNFPDYTIPYTAAHELSHQRGIAREDEANFMAFLVCIESDDPYIRYSGYQSLLEYLMSDMYKADKSLYSQWLVTLNAEVRGEMAAYNEFFKKYEKNVAAKVSSKVNDVYLKSQGTQGSVSYGLVTNLAVIYLLDVYNSQQANS
ncbi:MAG: DUF3810 domain-containing protein [Eubacteriales bacterium]|nr:DUF3810 domain-containing protein [Clostridiales bacterium]